ncbi:MAG: AI-2E family transporter [Burkholderiales bacterium]|jgi:predicted PurR-regulated permease PerM
MSRANRFDKILGIGMLGALVIGCLLVLLPFVTALLMAAILTYSTWPVNVRLREALGGRKTLAAGLMMVGACVLLVAPFVFVAMSLADSIAELVEASRKAFAHGPPQAPAWLIDLPLVGDTLASYWDTLTHDSTRLFDDLKGLIAPAQSVLLTGGSLLFAGLLQLGLSVLVAFFLYRDGEAAAARITRMAGRIGGARGLHLLHVAGNTVLSVVYGILGTALAQGLVAGIGFVIAGVPGAALLGLITFFLSVVPVGPPLVWVPAALWLFSDGSTGWAIFLAVWGVLGISMVDNVLKPIIISKGSNLPFMLGFLGVLGGVATLGFIGIFIGPTLLAVGYRMFNEWVDTEELGVHPVVDAARAETPPSRIAEDSDVTKPVPENERFPALSKK